MSKEGKKDQPSTTRGPLEKFEPGGELGQSKTVTNTNRGLILCLRTNGNWLRKTPDLLIFASTSPCRR